MLLLHVRPSLASRLAVTSPTRSNSLARRCYATPSSLSTTRATGRASNGAVPWKSLSSGEKAIRTTQQSVNLLVVIAGIVATGTVATFLYTDLLSPAGKISQFNQAVSRIREDPRCLQVLVGPDAIHRRKAARQIEAFGEGSWNKWARNRAIASRTETDRYGNDHLYMHFNVKGPAGGGTSGVAHLHLAKKLGQSDFQYQYLYLDVKGHQRIYLEDASGKAGEAKPSSKIFGIRWR